MNRGTATPRQNTPYMSRDIIPRRAVSERPRLSQGLALNDQQDCPAPALVAQVEPPQEDVGMQPRAEAHTTKAVKNVGIFTRYGLSGIASFFVIAGLVLIYMAYTNNIQVSEQVKAYTKSAADSGELKNSNSASGASSSSSGSSEASGTTTQLTTDPSKPRNISISSVGINASATEVGLNSKNEIGTPASIRNVSWYNGSSTLLDKAGTSVIVGHRGTDRYNGAFYKLDQVKAGAKVVATMGDGKMISYKVERSETVPSKQLDMSKYLSYLGNTTRVLYLITCEGEYNETTHSYPARVIVKAVGVE